MKKKLSLLLSLFLGILYCFYGCQTEKLRFEYEQLTSDFIKAELIYLEEWTEPINYKTMYTLTKEESTELLKDITQTTFTVLLGHPNNPAKHGIKLNYIDRCLWFFENCIVYMDIQGINILENYKEYSQYPWYDIGRNEEFMAILNYYIAKAEQQN